MELIAAADELNRALARLTFDAPVTHVYNPLVYARRSYVAYVEAYGQGRKRAVFLGMNPGPWGMAQTGVPFGDAKVVQGWLGLAHPVDRPAVEHPKRPVQGVDCRRSEVSGTRLWGAVQAHFGTPARFFRHFFVANYCPLCFLEASGRNRTPDQLPQQERRPLFEACDAHLRRMVRALSPRLVVGIGAFAANRARAALEGLELEVGQVLHPSPASPAANRGWAEQATRTLVELGICPGC
jgi:single-strand selective monofunctional uracil DNA glycosylase